ncbi:MAG: glycosyl transferase family 1 [Alsobacter sp.]
MSVAERSSLADEPPLAACTDRSRTAGVLYIVHDTSDAAVLRRVKMLEAGGGEVRLAGFRRSDACPDGVADFGQTHAAKLIWRAMAVLRICLQNRRHAPLACRADAIICRNLESLVIGWLLRRSAGSRARLVYEVLDIHRAMLGRGFPSRMLRLLERRLAASCSLVITSSPAFVQSYFDSINPLGVPVRLVENKVFPEAAAARAGQSVRLPLPAGGEPIVIGWFGVIRCRKSLAILSELARLMEGRLKVVIRGKVADHEFDDFAGTVERHPHLEYKGPYRNPDDLPLIYGDIDFSWAIDFFEEGQNSSWLLPNRLYEGCLYGAVPIALESVETGRWLAARGIGLVLPSVEPADIAGVLGHLDPSRRAELAAAVRRLPATTWSASASECRDIVGDVLGRPSLEPHPPTPDP